MSRFGDTPTLDEQPETQKEGNASGRSFSERRAETEALVSSLHILDTLHPPTAGLNDYLLVGSFLTFPESVSFPQPPCTHTGWHQLCSQTPPTL